ncbi:helicase-associated domain-containing protein [Paenibacillus sp. sgz5001063]|uniref:helicase-associated domain-containing protein n=1 Tax=Paenibacillus sp. sgz5001063 TaxID=3242474 RepID=UPI0036D370A2
MMGLSPEALLVLHQIIKAYAARPFNEAQAEQLSPVSLCRVDLHLALLELREAGMLELRQKLWGELLYQIPVEHLSGLLHKLFPRRKPMPTTERVTGIEAEAGPELAGELFRTLMFIAGDGLPVTAKGAVHKKSISRLAAKLTLSEELLKGLFPPEQLAVYPFPLPVMVMLDLLLCLGLIRRTESAYLVETDILGSWLQLTGKQMSNQLYGLILNRYGLLGPAEQLFRYIISSSAYHSGQWYMIRDVLAWMSEQGMAHGQSLETLEGSAHRWLKGLAGFGWCELGSTEDGSACFRWAPAKPEIHSDESAMLICSGSGIAERDIEAEIKGNQQGTQQAGEVGIPASKGFIIHPDFEVLVPRECPYIQRWILAACAELLHSDDIWSYRLTREKLESAAELGLSPQTVISWLASHAIGGLPEQVELSLEQWGKGIGRTELTQVILLACLSETDGNDIAAHPRLAGKLSRIGPLHFIIQAEDIGAVRKELGAAGMAPAKRIAGVEEKPGKEWPLISGSQVHLSSASAFSAYVPERGLLVTAPDLPKVHLNLHTDEEAMLTGLASVPQMWMKQWRQYHVTTAQKVMEQAWDWGIKVRLSVKGQIYEFVPAHIRRNPWEVQGVLLSVDSDSVEEACLGAEDWQEMQLIIPKMRRNSSSA